MRVEDITHGDRAKLEVLCRRFWSKVDVRGPDECWPWKACRSGRKKSGKLYGRFGLRGRQIITAHRAAYLLTHGEVADDLFVCHRCDYTLCCNPLHLWEGTAADNAADRDAKGRYVLGYRPSGEHHYRAKLTNDQVRIIRRILRPVPKAYLAQHFDVSKSTIERVLNGKCYRDVA